MYCKKCGNKVSDNAKFCTKCGTPVERIDVTNPVPKQEINVPDNSGTKIPQKKEVTKKTNTLTVVLIVLAILLIIALAGVLVFNFMIKNKDGDADKSDSVKTESVSDTEENTDEEEIAEEDEEEEKKDTTAEDAMAAYKDFLDGNLAAKYESEGITETLYQTKDRIEQIYTEFYGDDMGKILSVTSAYIDCGMDGVKELAVSYNGDISYSGAMVYIYGWDKETKAIKELYKYEFGYRTDAQLFECGVVSIGGSNGASNWGYNNEVITADGDVEFLYSMVAEGDPYYWSIEEQYSNGTSAMEKSAVANYLMDLDNGNQEIFDFLLEYRFDYFDFDNENYDDFYDIPRYYSAQANDLEAVKDAFKSAGVSFYTEDEIERMISDKLRQYKIKDSMLEKEVEWKELWTSAV